MSIGLLLFLLFVLVANIAIGYFIAILLGIGPPDFRTAWARVKLSVAGSLSQSGSGLSRLPQVKSVIGFVTSLVERFKKHAPSAPDESELPDELPSARPDQESTPTLPPSPVTPSPIPPTQPTQKSSDNNPGKSEQPNPPA